eukprot:gene10078-biopygen12289
MQCRRVCYWHVGPGPDTRPPAVFVAAGLLHNDGREPLPTSLAGTPQQQTCFREPPLHPLGMAFARGPPPHYRPLPKKKKALPGGPRKGTHRKAPAPARGHMPRAPAPPAAHPPAVPTATQKHVFRRR